MNTMAQSDSSLITLDMEFRPRFEFRNGFGELPDNNDSPAAFISNRTRITLDYNRPKFNFRASMQDIRIWGQFGQYSSPNGLGIFEAYVETQIGKNAWLKMGRQAVELDNGRLFSAANWNQASRAHEGINFIVKQKKWSSELMGFYNQNSEALFGTNTILNNYLALGLHYFNWKLNKHWSLMFQNSLDAYQASSPEIVYSRGTSGGRINFQHEKTRATLAGYYQYGQNSEGQKINAFYLQPEFSMHWKKLKLQLGAELISGDQSQYGGNTTRSFVTLYGVAFKFNGNLNQFTSFPEDVNNLGLLNPYLFTRYQITEKIALKLENHLFYTHRTPDAQFYSNTTPFLGYEADLKLKWYLNDFTSVESGIATMLVSETLREMRNQSINTVPSWAFVMVKFNPRLFQIKQPITSKSGKSQSED